MENSERKMKICIVDDEEILRVTLAQDVETAGHNVVDFESPLEALDYIKKNPGVEILITDVRMPEMSGLELLKKVKEINPHIFVIIITAFGTIQSAVEAIKLGAYDYITKPFEPIELLNLIDKIGELTLLQKYNREFSEHFQSKYDIDSFYGNHESVRKIKEEIKLVTEFKSSVLITGETGTGKELIANIIHYNSPRKKKPLVKVSCAILSKEIFESELFGHVKGAFTGADRERVGRFEEADGGTIYLDDVDDIPLDLQVKLLRVLQEQEIEKLGSSKTIKIDVRVIASTKADLKKLSDEGKFRKDLYYRLNIYPLHLPPLRERRDDIPILFDAFLKRYSPSKNIEVAEDVYDILKNYDWPGNTRELKNLVERLVIISREGKITAELIPNEFKAKFAKPTKPKGQGLVEMVQNLEINLIKGALEKSAGNKNKAAEILNIPVSTLRSKIEKYNLA